MPAAKRIATTAATAIPARPGKKARTGESTTTAPVNVVQESPRRSSRRGGGPEDELEADGGIIEAKNLPRITAKVRKNILKKRPESVKATAVVDEEKSSKGSRVVEKSGEVVVDEDLDLPSEKPANKSKASSRAKGVKVEEEEVEAEVQEDVKATKKRKTKEEKEKEAMPLADRTQGLKHYIGAHVSIAKGAHNAVHNALHIGGNAFALFLKSQRKWDNPALQTEHITLFHGLCKDHAFEANNHVLPHGSYLVNLASTSPEMRTKSIASFLDDLRRCQALGIGLYNFHPGNTNGAPKKEGCKRIADAVNEGHKAVPGVVTLLETMASNKSDGNAIGGRFEDLAEIIKDVDDKSRVGVCVDTCHVFAAGYDIRSKEGFEGTMKAFDRVVGRQYLRAWHLNDSKAPMGSGRDLHANIGTGFLGLPGFWNVMNMSVWGAGVGVHGVPMVLETPNDEWTQAMVKGKDGKEEMKGIEDKGVWAREIKLLESLVGMDPDGDAFRALDAELSERGKAQREKMSGAIDKRKDKDKKKEAKAKAGKTTKRKRVGDESELSEVSGSD